MNNEDRTVEEERFRNELSALRSVGAQSPTMDQMRDNPLLARRVEVTLAEAMIGAPA